MTEKLDQNERLSSSQSPKEFLNYFGKDKKLQLWFADQRTKLTSVIFPPIARLGIVPDTISYVGISLLAGVILYFVRKPWLAAIFLLCHIICDGLDGAYARNTNKASQSGAFTDLVCDQFGMVVVAMLAIFHHLVEPLIGAVYVTLYLMVVVFGVIINVMGLQARITITSKYFLYIIYGIWAFTGQNFFYEFMAFFSAIMAIEVIVGYIRLKRGIRKKFDALVRFSVDDIYSGKLHYIINVTIPVLVLAMILVGGNWIPIKAMMAKPSDILNWTKLAQLIDPNEPIEILGFGANDNKFLFLLRRENEKIEVRQVDPSNSLEVTESFQAPAYIQPSFKALPIYDKSLLIADSSTRLLMGLDLEASFKSKKAVTTLTLPLGYLRVTAMSTTQFQGKTVWLAANYLYTRKTYVIDPELALKKGYILGGLITYYINGSFPSGLEVDDDMVIELNRSPFNSLLYLASLNKLTSGKDLLASAILSFAPPEPDAIGPVKIGNDIVMLTPTGLLYKLDRKSVLK
ncbi:MAG: CDP-alcohol phosphatidyltransferase family protein [Desulfomonilaceae bacterium]